MNNREFKKITDLRGSISIILPNDHAMGLLWQSCSSYPSNTNLATISESWKYGTWLLRDRKFVTFTFIFVFDDRECLFLHQAFFVPGRL